MIYFTNQTSYMVLWAISNCYYIPMSVLIIMVPIFVMSSLIFYDTSHFMILDLLMILLSYLLNPLTKVYIKHLIENKNSFCCM